MADAADGARPPGNDGEGPFERLINWLRQLGRGRNGEQNLIAELEELIEEHEETPIDPHERRLLINILKLHEETAADVMVPRVDIVAMPVDTSLADAARRIAELGHSRVPIYRENLDDAIGMVHFKDVLPYLVDGRSVALADLVRKVLFVAPSMPVLDLLLQMRLSRVHMALVVDEFGGIDGLVTIEDVIEEIVGEIEDEHDDADQPRLVERGDGTTIADARTPIATLEARAGVKLLPHDHDEVETLGGLVFALAGRVPVRGEVIEHPAGVAFEVLDADARRVKRLRVRGLPPETADHA